jgi:hypothetical protein
MVSNVIVRPQIFCYLPVRGLPLDEEVSSMLLGTIPWGVCLAHCHRFVVCGCRANGAHVPQEQRVFCQYSILCVRGSAISYLLL